MLNYKQNIQDVSPRIFPIANPPWLFTAAIQVLNSGTLVPKATRERKSLHPEFILSATLRDATKADALVG